MRTQLLTAIACGVATLATHANAAVTITQQVAPAPTYTTLLNFDQPGQATGVLPANYWQSGYGVTIDAGDGVPFVDEIQTVLGYPWLPAGNQFFGNFGVFMTFDSPLSSLSFQAWDPSGPPSFFGGGLAVYVMNDGDVLFADAYTPAWAGVGSEWYNIVATGGMEFDEVRVLGNGFGPTTIIDNISWNTVPTPGAIALFGLAGVFARRRR